MDAKELKEFKDNYANSQGYVDWSQMFVDKEEIDTYEIDFHINNMLVLFKQKNNCLPCFKRWHSNAAGGFHFS